MQAAMPPICARRTTGVRKLRVSAYTIESRTAMAHSIGTPARWLIPC